MLFGRVAKPHQLIEKITQRAVRKKTSQEERARDAA